MKEIKTVALVGLGAIGAYFADRLQPVLGDDLRVIAGGARAERIRREGLVINGKQEYYHVVEPVSYTHLYGWENIVYSLMRISSVKVGNTVSFFFSPYST